MFTLRSQTLINPEISKYIKETTNKSLEKYKYNIKSIISTDTNNSTNFLLLLPFVSLFSVLLGYKLGKLTK